MNSTISVLFVKLSMHLKGLVLISLISLSYVRVCTSFLIVGVILGCIRSVCRVY